MIQQGFRNHTEKAFNQLYKMVFFFVCSVGRVVKTGARMKCRYKIVETSQGSKGIYSGVESRSVRWNGGGVIYWEWWRKQAFSFWGVHKYTLYQRKPLQPHKYVWVRGRGLERVEERLDLGNESRFCRRSRRDSTPCIGRSLGRRRSHIWSQRSFKCRIIFRAWGLTAMLRILWWKRLNTPGKNSDKMMNWNEANIWRSARRNVFAWRWFKVEKRYVRVQGGFGGGRGIAMLLKLGRWCGVAEPPLHQKPSSRFVSFTARAYSKHSSTK